MNPDFKSTVFVVDNFYSDPHAVRKLALQQHFEPNLEYFKGKRTQRFDTIEVKDAFEKIIKKKITLWDEYGANGVFQYCTPDDPIVYHGDAQMYAGIVYLTPDAPHSTGTTFLRSNGVTKTRYNEFHKYDTIYPCGHYDSTQFDEVDVVGNVFNRLVIWDARIIHAASCYFGTNVHDARLFQIFFFDVQE